MNNYQHKKFLESYCTQKGLKYVDMTNHNNEVPLYLWSDKHNQYVETSLNISNLTESQIKNLVDNHIRRENHHT